MTTTPTGGGDQAGATTTPEPAAPAPKRAPTYLHYNRSSTSVAWGVALVVLAQFALGFAAFDTLRHWVISAATIGASGLDITLVIFGCLAGLFGLMTLVIGAANLAGNIDLVAWSTRERMRTAAIAAGLDEPKT